MKPGVQIEIHEKTGTMTLTWHCDHECSRLTLSLFFDAASVQRLREALAKKPKRRKGKR